MMQEQFAGPGVQGLNGPKVYEGHGHQSRAHGAENPGGFGAAIAIALLQRDGGYGDTGQDGEANGDEEQGALLIIESGMKQFQKMYADGDGAENISGCDDGRKAASERKMEQDRGQQAQYRETEEHDDLREVRISSGCNQGGEGADVPEEGETGGREGQPTAAQARAGAVAKEQV